MNLTREGGKIVRDQDTDGPMSGRLNLVSVTVDTDRSEFIKDIVNTWPETTIIDGMDEAIVGVSGGRLVYDKDAIIRQLVTGGKTIGVAVLYYADNMENSYVGHFTPIFVDVFAQYRQ